MERTTASRNAYLFAVAHVIAGLFFGMALAQSFVIVRVAALLVFVLLVAVGWVPYFKRRFPVEPPSPKSRRFRSVIVIGAVSAIVSLAVVALTAGRPGLAFLLLFSLGQLRHGPLSPAVVFSYIELCLFGLSFYSGRLMVCAL